MEFSYVSGAYQNGRKVIQILQCTTVLMMVGESFHQDALRSNYESLTLSDLGELKHSMPWGGGQIPPPPLFIFAVA